MSDQVPSLPLYFQILGSSATVGFGLIQPNHPLTRIPFHQMAGIRMLPFSFVMALFAIGSGIVVAKMGRYSPTIWFGLVRITSFLTSTQ